jgi:outer membrane lipoprotein-sorting protein
MRTVAAARWLVLFALVSIPVSHLAARHLAPRQNSQPSVQEVVKAVESRYHSSRTLKAVFLERYNEGRLTTRVESGTAYFSRPGRMRWEYESPEEELFLSDGKTTWFYVPSEHTVSRVSVKESSDWRTPLALLTGKASLNRYCKRIDFGDPPHDTPTNVTLRCVPVGTPDPGKAANGGKNASPRIQTDADQALSPDAGGQIQSVLLEVDPRTGWLAAVTIRQSGGIQLEFRFGKWEGNVEVPESMFHFVAPKGVAIVDGDNTGTTTH